MITQTDTPSLSLENIFHPSDFSQASEVAFAHALKLALVASTELHIMHVAPETNLVHWTNFPGVRSLLVRWGLLPEGSAQEEVAKLGPRVQKILASHVDPVDSILHYLHGHPTDLVVLATHQREGLARWLHKAVAAPLARRAGTMTLFVPHGAAGFVSLADGAISLQRLLLPIDTVPRISSSWRRRGTVLEKLVEPGEVITAGTPLITLVDLSRLHAKVYVAEAELGKAKVGDPARVYTDAFPERYFEAAVSQVAQQAEFTPRDVHMRHERVTLVFAVKLAIDNPQGMYKPGMPVDAHIRWDPQAPWEKRRE